MSDSDEPVMMFGPYRIEPTARRLTRDGVAVPLGGRAFDTLAALAAVPGSTVSKEALLDAVWPGLTVEENNLQVQISALRKVLGGDCIVTVPGRGYRLVAPEQAGAKRDAPLALPERPSLVVLPFANLSGDPEQAYFADGMVEDITTALSRNGGLFVIARNSAFTYKGRAVDVKEIGRELGVRYVLEGSVRRAANRVRMTCQLISAETAMHVWADRFEGPMDDIFELQDRITESVVGAIEPSLRRAEIVRSLRKPTSDLGAYDIYLQALHLYDRMTRDDLLAASGLLGRAIAIDPGFVLAKATLAYQTIAAAQNFWIERGGPEERYAAQKALAAIAEAPDDPMVLRLAGLACCVEGFHRAAGQLAVERALKLAPNSASIQLAAGCAARFAGRDAEAMDLMARGMRASPLDSEMRFYLILMAGILIDIGRPHEALETARRAIAGRPGRVFGRPVLIHALVAAGYLDEARAEVRAYLDEHPGLTLAKIRIDMLHFVPAIIERRLAALRVAGMPE